MTDPTQADTEKAREIWKDKIWGKFVGSTVTEQSELPQDQKLRAELKQLSEKLGDWNESTKVPALSPQEIETIRRLEKIRADDATVKVTSLSQEELRASGLEDKGKNLADKNTSASKPPTIPSNPFVPPANAAEPNTASSPSGDDKKKFPPAGTPKDDEKSTKPDSPNSTDRERTKSGDDAGMLGARIGHKKLWGRDVVGDGPLGNLFGILPTVANAHNVNTNGLYVHQVDDASSGLKSGDVIQKYRIGGTSAPIVGAFKDSSDPTGSGKDKKDNYERFKEAVQGNPGKQLELWVSRDGKTIELPASSIKTTTAPAGFGFEDFRTFKTGFGQDAGVYVRWTEEKSPAAVAGLGENSVITEVKVGDGKRQPVRNAEEFAKILDGSGGKTVTFFGRRDALPADPFEGNILKALAKAGRTPQESRPLETQTPQGLVEGVTVTPAPGVVDGSSKADVISNRRRV